MLSTTTGFDASEAAGRASARSPRAITPLLALLLAVGAASPAGALGRPDASSRAILAAGVLTGSDVPAGWKSSKQPDFGSSALRGIRPCRQLAGSIDAARRAAAHKLSRTFTDEHSPDALSAAQNIVYLFRRAASAGQHLHAYRSPSVTTCLSVSTRKGVGSKSHVDVGPIPNLGSVGDDVVGYEAQVHGMNQAGAPITAVLDLVVVRVGRVIVAFDFANEGAQLPQARAMVQAVTDRVRRTSPR